MYKLKQNWVLVVVVDNWCVSEWQLSDCTGASAPLGRSKRRMWKMWNRIGYVYGRLLGSWWCCSEESWVEGPPLFVVGVNVRWIKWHFLPEGHGGGLYSWRTKPGLRFSVGIYTMKPCGDQGVGRIVISDFRTDIMQHVLIDLFI